MTVITAAAAALISAAAFMKLKDIREGDSDKGSSIVWLATALVVFLVADISAAIRMNETGVVQILSTSLIINFMFLLSVTDIRHRVIPNIYVAGVMLIRTVLILVQGISGHTLKAVFISSFAGAAAGFLILGIVSAISGKGLGGGDVKMFAAAGYFTGVYGVTDILIYTTVLCALCGLVLIVMKKCSVKDCIPMAPFAFAGTLVYTLMEV